MRCQTPTSREFDLIGPGGAQVCVLWFFLKLPRWFYFAAKVENHWLRPVVLNLGSQDGSTLQPRLRTTGLSQYFT